MRDGGDEGWNGSGSGVERHEEPLVRIAARRAVKRLRKDATTPEFGRLLQYQASSAAGDALLAVALASTLFFSVPDASDAKTRLAGYLILTVAPFAIVTPVLARVLDRFRGSLRWAMVITAVGRATLAWWLSTRIDDLALYPLAFGMLIMSRASSIVKGAVLPGLVPEDGTLVDANSAVSRIGAIAGIIAGVPAVLLSRWPGVSTELLVTAAVFYIGVIPAIRLPRLKGRIDTSDRAEAQARANSFQVRQGLVSVAGMRALVGFLVFHLAFVFGKEDFGEIGLGMLLSAAVTGNLVGAITAPRLRRRMPEDGILAVTLLASGIAGIVVGFAFTVVTAGIFVFVFGVATGAAKVAFDSVVQHEIPEGGRGWAFARFESILQLAWVGGGLVPLLIKIPNGTGVVLVGIGSITLAGLRFWARVQRGSVNPPEDES